MNLWRGAAWTFAIVLLAAPPVLAQKGGSPHGTQGSSEPTSPVAAQPGLPNPEATSDPFGFSNTAPTSNDLAGELGHVMDNEACNTWTESGVHSPTVSAKRLGVPSRASGEFQKGCSALKGKKYPEAEDHLRRAVDIYQDYSAAWVLLGQVLDLQDKKDDAQVACWKSKEIDSSYLPAYLCLADFAAEKADWDGVADLAKQALDLDPTSNGYAFYYAAAGDLHRNRLAQAEVYARAALRLDTWHRMPELHLLMAQICDAEKDTQGEATQLREFLKMAPTSKDAAAVKNQLAQLEARPAK